MAARWDCWDCPGCAHTNRSAAALSCEMCAVPRPPLDKRQRKGPRGDRAAVSKHLGREHNLNGNWFCSCSCPSDLPGVRFTLEVACYPGMDPLAIGGRVATTQGTFPIRGEYDVGAGTVTIELLFSEVRGRERKSQLALHICGGGPPLRLEGTVRNSPERSEGTVTCTVGEPPPEGADAAAAPAAAAEPPPGGPDLDSARQLQLTGSGLLALVGDTLPGEGAGPLVGQERFEELVIGRLCRLVVVTPEGKVGRVCRVCGIISRPFDYVYEIGGHRTLRYLELEYGGRRVQEAVRMTQISDESIRQEELDDWARQSVNSELARELAVLRRHVAAFRQWRGAALGGGAPLPPPEGFPPPPAPAPWIAALPADERPPAVRPRGPPRPEPAAVVHPQRPEAATPAQLSNPALSIPASGPLSAKAMALLQGRAPPPEPPPPPQQKPADSLPIVLPPDYSPQPRPQPRPPPRADGAVGKEALVRVIKEAQAKSRTDWGVRWEQLCDAAFGPNQRDPRQKSAGWLAEALQQLQPLPPGVRMPQGLEQPAAAAAAKPESPPPGALHRPALPPLPQPPAGTPFVPSGCWRGPLQDYYFGADAAGRVGYFLDPRPQPRGAAFAPCLTWQGTIAGYYFGDGSAGLGYYRDPRGGARSANPFDLRRTPYRPEGQWTTVTVDPGRRSPVVPEDPLALLSASAREALLAAAERQLRQRCQQQREEARRLAQEAEQLEAQAEARAPEVAAAAAEAEREEEALRRLREEAAAAEVSLQQAATRASAEFEETLREYEGLEAELESELREQRKEARHLNRECEHNLKCREALERAAHRLHAAREQQQRLAELLQRQLEDEKQLLEAVSQRLGPLADRVRSAKRRRKEHG